MAKIDSGETTVIVNGTGQPVMLANGTRFPSVAVVTVFRATAPALTVALEVQDGKPLVTQLAIGTGAQPAVQAGAEPTSSSRAITAADLRSIRFDHLVEVVVRALANHLWVTDALSAPDGIDRVGQGLYARLAGTEPEWRKSEDGAATMLRRQRLTDDLLRRVAEIARKHPERPTKAVEEQLFTSHRNATRWIAAARERGLLVDGFSTNKGEK
jgi:hypothetical protein